MALAAEIYGSRIKCSTKKTTWCVVFDEVSLHLVRWKLSDMTRDCFWNITCEIYLMHSWNLSQSISLYLFPQEFLLDVSCSRFCLFVYLLLWKHRLEHGVSENRANIGPAHWIEARNFVCVSIYTSHWHTSCSLFFLWYVSLHTRSLFLCQKRTQIMLLYIHTYGIIQNKYMHPFIAYKSLVVQPRFNLWPKNIFHSMYLRETQRLHVPGSGWQVGKCL